MGATILERQQLGALCKLLVVTVTIQPRLLRGVGAAVSHDRPAAASRASPLAAPCKCMRHVGATGRATGAGAAPVRAPPSHLQAPLVVAAWVRQPSSAAGLQRAALQGLLLPRALRPPAGRVQVRGAERPQHAPPRISIIIITHPAAPLAEITEAQLKRVLGGRGGPGGHGRLAAKQRAALLLVVVALRTRPLRACQARGCLQRPLDAPLLSPLPLLGRGGQGGAAWWALQRLRGWGGDDGAGRIIEEGQAKVL